MSEIIPFVGWPKIFRYKRGVIVTEKIDGTNAQVRFMDDGKMLVGSRNRWITPSNDNNGFAKWCEANETELRKLGPGSHFGEWWGSGIQRNYGLKEKRFSLFNSSRWANNIERPACVGVVPVLWCGELQDFKPDDIMTKLKANGSYAAPGYMDPEGIVVFHTAGNTMFKITFDDNHKG